jgi:predicted amidohydrolase
MPELCRQLAVEHDVDLIFHPSAYSRDSSFYSWHQFVTSRAIENQVFFLSLNRAGKNFGKSIFCTPWVDDKRKPIVFPEHDEELQRLSLDCAEIDLVRDRIPLLRDRLVNYDLPLIDTPITTRNERKKMSSDAEKKI